MKKLLLFVFFLGLVVPLSVSAMQQVYPSALMDEIGQLGEQQVSSEILVTMLVGVSVDRFGGPGVMLQVVDCGSVYVIIKKISTGEQLHFYTVCKGTRFVECI